MKFNFSQIIKEVANDNGLDIKITKKIIKSFVKNVTNKLLNGHEVNILTLGKFYIHIKPERYSYSFKEKKIVKILAKKYPKFEFARSLKDKFEEQA